MTPGFYHYTYRALYLSCYLFYTLAIEKTTVCHFYDYETDTGCHVLRHNFWSVECYLFMLSSHKIIRRKPNVTVQCLSLLAYLVSYI